MTDPRALLTISLTERIGAILHGHPPEVQGAVLADLVSMWLAGHVATDRTAAYREAQFKHWCETVRKLVPVNEKMIFDRLRKESH